VAYLWASAIRWGESQATEQKIGQERPKNAEKVKYSREWKPIHERMVKYLKLVNNS